MLKNYNGFSLLEVLVSFSLLLLIITFIVPMLMKVHEERAMIDYKRKALLVLHNEIEAYLYGNSEFPRQGEMINSGTYVMSIELVGELERICIQWETPAKKKGKTCHYVKKM